MPIYEFKCSECQDLFELLVVKSGEDVEMKCPKCGADTFERVMSAPNYAMGAASGGSAGGGGAHSRTRTCSGGSCTTYEVPGHAR